MLLWRQNLHPFVYELLHLLIHRLNYFVQEKLKKKCFDIFTSLLQNPKSYFKSLTMWSSKQSTLTVGTESHACIQLERHETLFFMAKMASSMDCRHMHWKTSLGLKLTALILDAHFRANWHLSNWGICLPVSMMWPWFRGHWGHMFSFKLVAEQLLVFDWIASQVYLLGT